MPQFSSTNSIIQVSSTLKRNHLLLHFLTGLRNLFNKKLDRKVYPPQLAPHSLNRKQITTSTNKQINLELRANQGTKLWFQDGKVVVLESVGRYLSTNQGRPIQDKQCKRNGVGEIMSQGKATSRIQLLQGQDATKFKAQESGAITGLRTGRCFFLQGKQVTTTLMMMFKIHPENDLALNVDHVFKAMKWDAIPTLMLKEDEYHDVHEMQNDVQPNYVVDSDTDYTSDSNIIPGVQRIIANKPDIGVNTSIEASDQSQRKQYKEHMESQPAKSENKKKVETTLGHRNNQYVLNKTDKYFHTENGTDNSSSKLFRILESDGIFHQNTVPRTLNKTSLLKDLNRTLVEVSNHMMIVCEKPPHVSIGGCAELVATADYFHPEPNPKFILCHNKTPYELVHDKKPDLTFSEYLVLCAIPTNDSEKLGKFQAKMTFGNTMCKLPSRKGYRIYNKRTRRLWK
ncbi:retrovirus-related pol polyprotein from transposon TNT 1-94 [Tanacetum coccineum]